MSPTSLLNMDANGPLLTVAITTFNYAHFLPDAVASVMRQGVEDCEILIFDNASEDNTEEVVNSLKNPLIRYVRHSSNLGPHENGNRCLASSRGRYVKFLCADDVLRGGVLRKQLNVFEANPNVVLVTCGYLSTDSQLNVQEAWCAFPGQHPGRRLINYSLSRMVNCIGGPSNIMIRRQAAAGIYSDKNYSLLADLKFALQVLERGDYASINEPGVLYRRHANSDFATNCPPQIHMPEYMRLVTEFNAWNPMNWTKALLSGCAEARQRTREHWREAFTGRRMAGSIEASAEAMYNTAFRFINQRKAVSA